MVEGRWLPYVDAVSHRGPVYYWVTAVLVKTCGWSSWLAMRVGTLSCMLLTLGLGFAAALVAKRSLAAGVMVLVAGLQVMPMRGESLPDALRLLYVAMTRANHTLVLSAHGQSAVVQRVQQGLAAVGQQFSQVA